MLSYPVEFTADDNDTVMVTSPDFPELTTYGADRDDALYHAIDAFEEVLAGRMAYREDIPTPSKGKYRVLLATQVALKVALYQAMRESRLRKVDLARRLGWHGKQVDRLLDLDHATRLDVFDAAFAALGKDVALMVVDAEATRSSKKAATG